MGAVGTGAIYRFDRFVLDASRGVLLSAESQEIALRPKAFKLLRLLVENPERLLDRDTIMQAVWSDVIISDDGITQCVSDIRRALADHAQRIVKTVPRRGYILAAEVTLVRDKSDPVLRMAVLADRPSIAVLPFTNLSDDPEQEFFSDGIVDDIVTDLSRSRSLFVNARNTSFAYRDRSIDVKQVARELGVHYLVEGSVRREAGRARINIRLIDADAGNHIWAERYDRPLRDVLAVQDDITSAVAKAIQPVIMDAEYRRVLRMPPDNLGAWEAYHRGLWHVSRASPTDTEHARGFFERAITIDPAFAPAYGAMAQQIETGAARWGTRPTTEARQVAIEWAEHGVAIDPNDADARATLARILHASGKRSEGLEHVSLALASNPNSPRANFVRGEFLIFGGQPFEGRNLIMNAMRLDPCNAYNVDFLTLLTLAYYYERAFDKAAELAERTLARYPKNPNVHRFRAASLGQLGRSEEARVALQHAMTVSPASFDHFVRSCPPWLHPDDYEHMIMIDGLRKAGWQN